jgi:dCMP deaminase
MDKWDKRFMEVTELIGTWSSCYQENRHVGAIIVKNKRIIATGYNGAPAGIESCMDKGECMRKKLNVASGTRHELCYAVHAEQNAIIQAARKDMIGSTLYLTGVNPSSGAEMSVVEPCQICLRLIKNAGINRIINKKGVIYMRSDDGILRALMEKKD